MTTDDNSGIVYFTDVNEPVSIAIGTRCNNVMPPQILVNIDYNARMGYELLSYQGRNCG